MVYYAMSFVRQFNALPLEALMKRSSSATTANVRGAMAKSRLTLADFAELISPAAGELLEPLCRRSQALTQQSGLSSLTHPGGSQQHQSFGRMLHLWQRLTSGRRALHPCWTIGVHRGSHLKTLGPRRTLCRDENHGQVRVRTQSKELLSIAGGTA